MAGILRIPEVAQILSTPPIKANGKFNKMIVEIFRAMTRNFNSQYVYDYFFNPEKVKGK